MAKERALPRRLHGLPLRKRRLRIRWASSMATSSRRDIVRGTRTVPVTQQVLHDARNPAALTLPVVGADLAGRIPAAARACGAFSRQRISGMN